MNDREKKLIFILFGGAFFIVNIFLFSSYTEAKQKKEIQLKKNADELALKKKEIGESDDRISEIEWLIDNGPKEGVHAEVRADLVNFAEKSALRAGVSTKKRPSPLPENPDEDGSYSTARVEMLVNARDPEFYRWLIELQDPQKGRAVTFLHIKPQRDDNTRVECELVLTQWFTPILDDAPAEDGSN